MILSGTWLQKIRKYPNQAMGLWWHFSPAQILKWFLNGLRSVFKLMLAWWKNSESDSGKKCVCQLETKLEASVWKCLYQNKPLFDITKTKISPIYLYAKNAHNATEWISKLKRMIDVANSLTYSEKGPFKGTIM